MLEVITASVDELIGRTLRPGLRIDEILGSGTFGTVYRGRQLAIDRDVAVKVLHPWFDPETEPARLFQDEIRAIGRIDHRNAVRIFDADVTADGRMYFVMELITGPTCLELAEAGPMPPARAVHLVAQLLDGLAAVHAAGHIHADVKPSNVLVTGDAASERVVLIDFGLSRLRQLQGPAEAVGGTRAFMAPEQLRAWHVEPRSDVYSAALVLVRLLTGWQRPSAAPGVAQGSGPESGDDPAQTPPLGAIEDLALRTALERALAAEPADRPSAADFVRALRGGSPDEPVDVPPPPFRQLLPLTERDRGRLYGRDAEILRLARALETDRATVLTAPSGTGKSSLLRAGLVPYLDAAGSPCAYVSCRAAATAEEALALVASSIAPGEAALAAALAGKRGRLVLVLDQIETWLTDARVAPAILDELLSLEHRPAEPQLAVLLSVREDFLAQLMATTPALARGVPLVRLAPLDRAGAELALTAPLRAHGITVAPALLEQLLDELTRAGREHGSESGWDVASAIYPPHLQLLGAELFSALAPGETELRREHYDRLGGFESIVGESLERILRELSTDDRRIARELFLTFVGAAHTRAARSEDELVAQLEPLPGAAHPFGPAAIASVLARMEAHRLLQRRTRADGVVIWELTHDSLIPRIEAWLTVQDLDRRRAAELLRFHLRESTPQLPSLLSARQLRQLAHFPGLLDELEREWSRRPATAWTPQRLLARSRMALQYRRALTATVAAIMALLALLLGWSWLDERQRRADEIRLRDLDLGRFDLRLVPFDWEAGADGVHAVARPASQLPALRWELHEPHAEDRAKLGPLVEPERLRRGQRQDAGGAWIERGIEARGGEADLVILGRGGPDEGCSPSIVSLKSLPGYASRGRATPELRIAVPSCQATRFDMIEIPAGPFVFGGAGEPPASFARTEIVPEDPTRELKAFAIDRTEVTNAAFSAFAELAPITGLLIFEYPTSMPHIAGPTYPHTDLNVFDATAFCRYLGKQLPTSEQWQKAMRGGLTLPGGVRNPFPRRNLPWGPSVQPVPARLVDASQSAPYDRPGSTPVDAFPADRSPYGVIGMAGNVHEWTRTEAPVTKKDDATKAPPARTSLPMRITRGGNWFNTRSADLVDFMTSENERSPRQSNYYLGARCVEER